jgi:hypothetical protein
MFEILDYYDTCEKLVITNNRSIGIYGIQLLSRLVRKVDNFLLKFNKKKLFFIKKVNIFRVIHLKI